MKTIELKIIGMTCEHCAATTADALNALPGVVAEISFSDGVARIENRDSVETSQLIKAIEQHGYGARCLSTADEPVCPENP